MKAHDLKWYADHPDVLNPSDTSRICRTAALATAALSSIKLAIDTQSNTPQQLSNMIAAVLHDIDQI